MGGGGSKLTPRGLGGGSRDAKGMLEGGWLAPRWSDS